jgi:hypothetical protein
VDGDEATVVIEYTTAAHSWLSLGIINYCITATIVTQSFVYYGDRFPLIE